MTDRIDDPYKRPDRCETCRFYDTYNEGDEVGHGECHRRSPLALSGMLWAACLALTRKDAEAVEISASSYSFWPHVMAYDWCGEWHD